MSTSAASAGFGWQFDTIRDLLMADPRRSYLTRGGQDRDRELALDEWTVTASSPVRQTTARVEVVVRNALDAEHVSRATRRGPVTWLDDAPRKVRRYADIDRARVCAAWTRRSTLIHGKVIAEPGLGFWGSRIDSLFSETSATWRQVNSRDCTRSR